VSRAILPINGERLMRRLHALAAVGQTAEGACCRLALSEEDRAGRDLVVQWMQDLGLQVSVDPMGNIFGYRPGRREDLAPIMTGSHIDTVRTGGIYDGNLGVLAGLEIIECLNEAQQQTERGLVVAIFTNEEGVRFTPDMLGSLVYANGMSLAQALAITDKQGVTLGTALEQIGYAGTAPLGVHRPHAFVELHIEQGPVLDSAQLQIGVVEHLQGISWQEITIRGQANHAGTTPMALRHDAGYAAAAVMTFVRELAREMGGHQVATVGQVKLTPNVVNVIAAQAVLTVDLRNTDEALLNQARERLVRFLAQLEQAEGVSIQVADQVLFAPVSFDADLTNLVEQQATQLGLSHRRLNSGAGHDAQMLSRICRSAMIFVPSVAGISHNPAEHTEPADLVAGCQVLCQTLLVLTDSNAIATEGVSVLA